MAKTILVTDDDSDVASIISSALTGAGYNVICVCDGVSAVETLQAEHIDLIILDIMMPVFSGYWFCDFFKKNPQTKNIPVIFISALSSEEDVRKGMDLGASAYLTKPFKMKMLIETVSSFF